MEAYNQSKYPVFEADQVLSHKHLNAVVSHLEEQDRLTRKDLVGIGIVCGLELDFSPTSIRIKCGNAVTSLGYLIEWEEQTFSFYNEIELSKDFLEPKYAENESYLAPILSLTSKYASIKNCIELYPSKSEGGPEKPITSGFFNGKKVVLLLETSFIDQKNCIASNCDDKGKRIDFKLRPIVIPSGISEEDYFKSYPTAPSLLKIKPPRYNVPASSLKTGREILMAFKMDSNNSKLNDLSQNGYNLYNHYRDKFEINTTLFQSPSNLKDHISDVIRTTKKEFNEQYVWDWINDIILAYNEIVDFSFDENVLCCVDEPLFPFHVVLGTENTIVDYRTPFFETKNANEKNNLVKRKAKMLFERWIHIINNWEWRDEKDIRITPSNYGSQLLGDKAIPNYYGKITELTDKWNPINSLNEVHSYWFNTNNENLEFDLEPFNFFNVEGHIGQNYNTALTQIKSIINQYRLPFDVIALNAANWEGQKLDRSKFDFDWSEFETDFVIQRGKMKLAIDGFKGFKNLNRKYINNIALAGLVVSLTSISELLTSDFKVFIQKLGTFLKIVDETKKRILILRKERFLSPDLLDEDIVDQLDYIHQAISDKSLLQLVDLAFVKWEKYSKEQFFTTFIEKHPGIDHKLGVTKQGTFILVYEDYSVFQKKEQIQQDEADSILIQEMRQLIHVDENELGLLENKSGLSKDEIMAVNEMQAKLADKIADADTDPELIAKIQLDFLNKLRSKVDNLSKEEIIKIRERILFPIKGNNNPAPLETVKQKVVIADFFLPYRCCANGNSIQFVLPKEEVPTKIGDFLSPDFVKNDFNTNQ